MHKRHNMEAIDVKPIWCKAYFQVVDKLIPALQGYK